MDEIIEREHEKVRNRLRAGAKDRDVLVSVSDRLKEIGGDLRQVYAGDGYTNFLVTFLKEEHEKYQIHKGYGPDEHDYDELRSEPTCHCGQGSCPVGNGKLPVTIRTADDLDAAIREYTHDHTANPVALHEARSAWGDKCAELESELLAMNLALSTNTPLDRLDEPAPDADDAADDDPADESGEDADQRGHDPTAVQA